MWDYIWHDHKSRIWKPLCQQPSAPLLRHKIYSRFVWIGSPSLILSSVVYIDDCCLDHSRHNVLSTYHTCCTSVYTVHLAIAASFNNQVRVLCYYYFYTSITYLLHSNGACCTLLDYLTQLDPTCSMTSHL
jgi:hypothetical protein